MIKNLTIVGLGQLGGSLLYALQSKPQICEKILVSTREESVLADVLKKKLASEATKDLKKILPKSDFVIFATPIDVLNKLLFQYHSYLKKGAIVTDLTSVMQNPVKANTSLLDKNHCFYISSHPMAGSEKTGFKHSFKENLYSGKTIFVCPHKNKLATDLLISFWENLGGNIVPIGAKEHDLTVAKSSHLLHVLSSLVTEMNLNSKNKIQWNSCAGAFKDFSRISSSSPEMWLDIFQKNKKELLTVIEEFQQNLDIFKKTLTQDQGEKIIRQLENAYNLHTQWIK